MTPLEMDRQNRLFPSLIMLNGPTPDEIAYNMRAAIRRMRDYGRTNHWVYNPATHSNMLIAYRNHCGAHNVPCTL